jgi:uncharacterized protein (DUF433 family)
MHHPFGMPEVFADPEIHGGQPVVESGVPIYLILDMLAQGFPPQEMEQDYGVTDEHVRIALRFAAEYVKHAGMHAA